MYLVAGNNVIIEVAMAPKWSKFDQQITHP